MSEPEWVEQILSSEWMESSLDSGLSPHLIASFYQVARVGEGKDVVWQRIQSAFGPGKPGTDPATVKAPLTEASMEMVLNWQSPFESAGPESRAPALMAMLQSGTLQPVVHALADGKDGKAEQKANAFLKRFEGRTGITKLNSTQVFNGMPPVKITVTALLRAWRDPASEVEAPFNKLMKWALPIELSKDGSILARAVETAKGDMGYVEALMPSLAPVCIAMKYKNRIFSPLVIESIGMPLGSPVDAKGHFVQLAVPMTLCTLTALDRKDWSEAIQTAL